MLSLCAGLCVAVASPSTEKCFSASEPFSITSQNGRLETEGKQFNLKGLSWFGFETSAYVFHGLWANDYSFYIDFMKQNDFNAIRIPFSAQMALTDPMPSSINFYKMNTGLQNLSSLQCLDFLVNKLSEANILVMLDMHSLEHDGYMENGLWYDDTYNATATLDAWKLMTNRYKSSWNVIAIDVFNEPFDATWGSGKPTDFDKWCQKVGDTVHGIGAPWLVFCEGVASSPQCKDACFWGEDLQGVATSPVTLSLPNKVVYSPHSYGPSVSAQPYFQNGSFPSNMPAIWDTHYGFIKNTNTSAVVVGEWGGIPTGADLVWMNAFASYLASNGMADNFFWCLNSDSGDTGGLLDGWKTPDTARLDICKKVQPNPSVVTHNSSHICIL